MRAQNERKGKSAHRCVAWISFLMFDFTWEKRSKHPCAFSKTAAWLCGFWAVIAGHKAEIASNGFSFIKHFKQETRVVGDVDPRSLVGQVPLSGMTWSQSGHHDARCQSSASTIL